MVASAESTYANFPEVTLVDGILNFPDTSILIQVLASLDAEISSANSQFTDQDGGLEEEAYNEMFDSLGLNEQQPLIDFENELSFISLRSIISAEHDTWLETDGENDELNPNRHFIVDNTVRSILNEFGEVKIGDTYYTLTEEGYSEASNLSTVISYRNKSSVDNVKLENGSSIGSPNSVICTSYKRNIGTVQNGSNNKKYEWVVSHWTYPWGRYATAKLDNYEKKRGRWRRFKEESIARAYGDVSIIEYNCDTKREFNGVNGTRAAAKDQEVKHHINVTTNGTTSRGWVEGYFKAGDIENTQILNW